MSSCYAIRPRETGELFMEPCKDNKRDRQTLMEIIRRRVKPGTHIITDCWAAYNGLDELGLSSLLVTISVIL